MCDTRATSQCIRSAIARWAAGRSGDHQHTVYGRKSETSRESARAVSAPKLQNSGRLASRGNLLLRAARLQPLERALRVSRGSFAQDFGANLLVGHGCCLLPRRVS